MIKGVYETNRALTSLFPLLLFPLQICNRALYITQLPHTHSQHTRNLCIERQHVLCIYLHITIIAHAPTIVLIFFFLHTARMRHLLFAIFTVCSFLEGKQFTPSLSISYQR